MALRGFLMLLRVTNVGFPSSLWKINILTWWGGRRWTTPGGPKNRFPFKKENVHQFLQYSGACCCRHDARQSYNHCRILHNYFSFTKSSSTYSVHGTDSTSVSNPVASRQHSSPQSSHYTDVPWWQWCPFDETSTVLTRLGFVRFLALSKSQISPCWEAFFKDPRPCSSCACRDEGHTCSEYQECFQKWRMRMQRFIEVEGSYFEGMWL